MMRGARLCCVSGLRCFDVAAVFDYALSAFTGNVFVCLGLWCGLLFRG